MVTEQTITKLETIFFCYVNTAINLFGFILSLLCLLIFLNKKFTGLFYNYIRSEILFGGMSLLSYAFRPFYYCKDTGINILYISNIIHLTNRYLRSVFEMTATLCCIISSLYFFLIIFNLEKSKYNILSKISFKIICSILVGLSSILFLFRLFEFTIVPISVNSTSTFYDNQTMITIGYMGVKSELSNTFYYKFNKIASFLISDGILVFILFILNIIIFIKVKKTIKTKRFMMDNASIKENNKPTSKKKLKNTENSIKFMVFVSSFNTIIGKFPLFVFYLLDTILDSNSFSIKVLINLFNFIAHTVFSLSYTINFVLYYFINNTFRRTVNGYIKKIWK